MSSLLFLSVRSLWPSNRPASAQRAGSLFSRSVRATNHPVRSTIWQGRWYMGSGLKAQNMTGIRAQSRGTQREYSSKPHKHSIVERTLVFKR